MGDIFLKLLNMSITASWLIVAVLGVRLLFRKIPKWVTCLLWGIVAIRLILPFSIESQFSLQPSAEPIKSSTIVEGDVVPYVPSIDSNLGIVENAVNPVLAETFAYGESESVAPLQVFTGIVGSVWLCGMLALLIFAVASMSRLRLSVREAVLYKENIYICDAVKSPFIFGIVKPRIYLSSALKEEEMNYIIAHEKAHLRRKDHLWKPFGYLLLCIYWFNPLCWIAYIMLCKDIELACDEKVIKDMSFGDKKEYSRVLLTCASQRRLVMVCPLAFGEVGVKERVKSVLNYKRPAFWITMIAVVVCVIVAICFLTNPSKEYQIRITIPAGSTEEILYQEDFCYSDEEISPTGNRIIIFLGEGMGDTEVVLKPIEVREENAYEPTYITPGMPVKMDVEKGAWFKIGVNMQNPTTEDIDVYVNVRNVEVRIASEDSGNLSESDGTDSNQDRELTDTEEAEENAVLQDLAYYLELSASDLSFRAMSETRKKEILEEYEELLDGYTLITRESTDGNTSYIVGHYNGDVTGSPLYRMQDMWHSSDKQYQIFYLEEKYEAMEKVKDEQGVQAITDEAYVIENSWMYRTTASEYIFIQPLDSEQELDYTFSLYTNPTRGREYIEDALARGIALNNVEEPYLSVYMISEKYGEITEKIPLTEEEKADIEKTLAESWKMFTGGFGFGASLYMNGETISFNDSKGVPQPILDLAMERCSYQFASPKSITASITEACLDCSWLEESLYLDEEHLSRLEEILKSAKMTGVGNCGYGAKLTLTLENGETMVVFKGTDDCGSLVFGSWGGYSISDDADDEFWEMFGLSADAHTRLFSDGEGTQGDYIENTEKPAVEPTEENTEKSGAEAMPVDTSKVSGIVVTNGNTGEQITLTAEEPAYKDLIKMYWQFDFTAEYEENTRVGYQYSMKMLDKEGKRLQSVTPYKDGVTIDGIFFKYDNTGNDAVPSLNLMDYLESIFVTKLNQQFLEEVESGMMEAYSYIPETENRLCNITDAKGLYALLSRLDYKPETCDGLPEYMISFDNEETFSLNITDKWVWRDKEEARLSDSEMSVLMSYIDISG